MVNASGCHRRYSLLKSNIAEQKITAQEFNKLKQTFAKQIGSVRRLDCIRTLAELIDCLERRDIISEDNVEPLSYFGGAQVHEMLSKYIRPNAHANTEYINVYQEERLSEELRQKLKLSSIDDAPVLVSKPKEMGVIANDRMGSSGSSSFSNTTGSESGHSTRLYPVEYTQDKRAAIYKLLARELGRDWRKLGRELEIRESDMDEIEMRFPTDLSSRIYKLMHVFEEDPCHNPKQEVLIICRALSECRRKDLRRKVEDIMSH